MTLNDDTTTIVPAEPGWRVCEAEVDENGHVTDLRDIEVIAWAITHTSGHGDPQGYALPVTADIGVVHENKILRSPSGRYLRPEERDFGTDRQAAVEEERKLKR